MSLIDDALKRAQAAQGEPSRPDGSPRAPVPLPDTGRARRRRTTQILLLAAIAIGIMAGLFALLRPRPAEVAPERAATEPPSAATPSAGIVVGSAPPSEKPASQPGREAPRITAPDVTVPPPVRAESSAPRPPSEAPEAAPPARAPEAPMRRELPAIARVEPPAPMVASGSPAIVRSEEPRVAGGRQPAVARGRNYVREVTLPSGGRLSLDGIVYSEENPAAVINGRVVRTGSFVEGFEVVRIRSDRVELRDEETTLVILLK